ncbi:MAG: hypothetical protein LBC74_02755, partial [Planctomycetaceae bacterium]|nr:hypothetical protein [Planctomycetaceae bacterium]
GRFVPKGFHHEGFAQVPPKNIRHNEFDRGAKNNFRKGEFKQPPFGKQHGELARKQEGKKYFDAPDKPKQKHNKKDVNKKEDRSKSSKPHLPLGDRS